MSTLGKPKPANSPKTGWSKYEQSMAEWRIKVPGHPPLRNRNHPPDLESSTCPTKTYRPWKNCTQFDTLPSELLHNIDTWHSGIIHCDNFKPVLVRLTQRNPLFFPTNPYKLKYVPFD